MRIFTYVFIISGIMTLLYFGGFTDLPTGSFMHSVLSGGVTGIQTTEFYVELHKILTLALGATIIAGLFARGADIPLLKGGFIAWFMGAFIVDMVWLAEKMAGYGDLYLILSGVIFVPLTIGFILSVGDWWTGND